MHKILVGSYTDEITTLEFDPDKASLEILSTVKTGQSPSWIAQHPTDRSLIFAANEVTDGKVQLFKLSDNGGLQFLEECSSGGADPASLAVRESSVIVANYSSGSVLQIPLSLTPPHLLSPTQPIVAFEGSGPNKDRQESSHPHQVIFHRNEILIPDLGADKVWRLTEQDGKLTVAASVQYEPGRGPRHAVIHNGVLYTALELANKVSSDTLPPLPYEPHFLSELPSLPPTSVAKSDMFLAEILLSPSTPMHPSPFIFVTNRNEPMPAGDSIAVYAPHHISSLPSSPVEKPLKSLPHSIPITINEATDAFSRPRHSSGAEFRYIGSVATGLQHLRAIALGGPDSRYLVAGGAQGGGVKVFDRNGASLREIAKVHVEKPTAFIWL